MINHFLVSSQSQPSLCRHCRSRFSTLQAIRRLAAHSLSILIWSLALIIRVNGNPIPVTAPPPGLIVQWPTEALLLIAFLLILVVILGIVIVVLGTPQTVSNKLLTFDNLPKEVKVWLEKNIEELLQEGNKLQGLIEALFCKLGLQNKEVALSRNRIRLLEELRREAQAHIHLRNMAIDHRLHIERGINEQLEIENWRIFLKQDRLRIERGEFPTTAYNHNAPKPGVEVNSGSQLLEDRSASHNHTSAKPRFSSTKPRRSVPGTFPDVSVIAEPEVEVGMSILSYTKMHVLTKHRAEVESLAFSPDGTMLASTSRDGTIKLWDTHSGDLIHEFKKTGAWSIAFSRMGDKLAAGYESGMVEIWQARKWADSKLFKAHSDTVMSLAFSPNDERIATASSDKTVKLWNPHTTILAKTITAHSEDVSSIVFSPKGGYLASASFDKTIRLWKKNEWLHSMQSGGHILEGHQGEIYSLSFSRDGKWLASASLDKTIRLWDTSTGQQEDLLEGHEDGVTSVAFSPKGRLLASASSDKTVKLWNIALHEPAKTYTDHAATVHSVAFSQNGQWLASASADKTVIIYQANDRD